MAEHATVMKIDRQRNIVCDRAVGLRCARVAAGVHMFIVQPGEEFGTRAGRHLPQR